MARVATQSKTNETVAQTTESAAVETPNAGSTETTETLDNDISKVDLSVHGTNKSAMMRALAALGYKNGPIAKELTKRFGKEVKYQFVRNVLAQQPKAAG